MAGEAKEEALDLQGIRNTAAKVAQINAPVSGTDL